MVGVGDGEDQVGENDICTNKGVRCRLKCFSHHPPTPQCLSLFRCACLSPLLTSLPFLSDRPSFYHFSSLPFTLDQTKWSQPENASVLHATLYNPRYLPCSLYTGHGTTCDVDIVPAIEESIWCTYEGRHFVHSLPLRVASHQFTLMTP